VGVAGEGEHFVSADSDGGLGPHEVADEFGGVAVLEASQLVGKHAVEGIDDDGHDHVEVHLGEDGGRQRVQVEELHGLGDAVLDAPAAGVVSDEQLDGRVGVVGDEEGGRSWPLPRTMTWRSSPA
jgi:hypothetical protein